MQPGDLDAPVLIAGAGPVGLSLALGLARHGVKSIVVERDDSLSEQSKAPGILPRTLEIFEQWGIAEEIVRRGIYIRSLVPRLAATNEPLLTVPLDQLSDECVFAGFCVLEQGQTERVLFEAIEAAGFSEVRFGHQLTAFSERDGGIESTIRFSGEEYAIRSRFLAGCDGASSTLRELLGLPFEGVTYPLDAVLADVRFTDARAELPFPRLAASGRRFSFAIRLESGAWRIVSVVPADVDELEDRKVDRETVDDLVELLFGAGKYESSWSSRFHLHRRSAPRYRHGRVVLAGDAAHVNSPVGAEGMNAGIHDAHNLAWKIAAILDGGDEGSLLESYHSERHEVITTEVNRFTDLLTRIVLNRRFLAPLLALLGRAVPRIRPIRRRLLRRAMMLAGNYSSSPLLQQVGSEVGERIPDVLLSRSGEEARLYSLIGLLPAVVFIDHPPVEVMSPHTVRSVFIGEDQWRDESKLLRRLIGSRRIAVVRPDHFIAWSGHTDSPRELEQALRAALGY
jgi:2-polyprenyl-6-methoxyphenol hydroxylase-like FAD-dependent oxidoreductase